MGAAIGVGLFHSYTEAPVDPAWAMGGWPGDAAPGALRVRFTGTSTLLFHDGETAWMVDGWFSRPGPLSLLLGGVEPDIGAIHAGLERNGVRELAFVIPVHSHYDHAMDSPEVARRTGALLLGSETTANIGRGWGLSEDRIRVVRDGEPQRFGNFTITPLETKHFQFPDPRVRERALGNPHLDAPLVPPVGAFDYPLGVPYALHVEHPRGSFLVQGSAGYVEGAFEGVEVHTVFLGLGGLGTQTADYREAYWRETVERVGAQRVIPIHWDSLTAPIEGPFRGPARLMAFLSSGGRDTLGFLRDKARAKPELVFWTLPRYEEVLLFP